MVVGGWAGSARGQATVPGDTPAAAPSNGGSAASAASPADGKSAAVTEETPLYYVRDQSGRLVPLLGFKYEEILQFIQEKKTGGEAQPSRYTLQQLICTGQAQQGKAQFEATYTIRLEAEQSDEIPLLRHGAVLLEPARHEGGGQCELRFDAKNESYTVRLRGAAQSDHKVILKFLAPVRNVEGESRIEFELSAAAASQLSLQVPEANIELSNRVGATEADVKSVEGGTQIEMWGLGGRLTIGWKTRDPRLTRSAPTLEATGQILARIDSHSVQFDATLSVRSRRTEFDRIHIRLPPGAQLVPAERADTGYTISASGEAGSQLLEVQLPEKTVGPVQIRVQAERAYDPTQADEILELAGFEVVEALPHRQWGQIAVAVVGDWQLAWGKLNRARQIGDLPSVLQQKDVIAGFEYFGQPASLTAHIAPRKTRINVEPEYVYQVGAKEVRLEGRLRYTIRGAKAFALDFELPGWVIDEIGPANLVDAESGLGGSGSPYSVPLIEPIAGQAELTIHAHRELAADASRVELTLPVPQCDVLGPATVVILPADNVRLRPRDEAITGLQRQSAAPNLPLPAMQQRGLFYRGERAGAKFIADIEQLPQAVGVTVDSHIDLHRDEVLVEQTLNFRVDFESASSFQLDVPRSLLEDPKATFVVDGKFQTVREPADAGDSASVRVDLPLGSSRIGNVEVGIRFRLPQAPLSPGTSAPLGVPLVMPIGAALGGNQLRVTAETGVQWDVNDPAWSVPSGAPLEPGNNLLVTDQPVSLLLMAITLDRRGPRTTVVERAWLQTWLSHNVRQDRAVYRFRSTEDQLQISLPMGTQTSKVEAKLDGQSLSTPTQGALNIKLPSRPAGGEHVLELRYQLESAGSSGSVELNLPAIEGSVWLQRMYLQLVVPPDWHLVSAPSQLMPEFSWDRSGLGWERHEAWDQVELENWSGAVSEEALPQETNRYLFSATGDLNHVSIWLAPRWQIVLVASLVVLAAGLVVLYLPAVRQPGVILAAAVVLLAVGVWQPDATLLLAQAGLLGVILAAAAAILKRLVMRRHWRGMVIRSAGSSISERDSTRRRTRVVEPASRPASNAGPAMLEASTSDSQSG